MPPEANFVMTVLPSERDANRIFEELLAHFADPASWRCYDDVGPALARLTSAGYQLAIASNFDRLSLGENDLRLRLPVADTFFFKQNAAYEMRRPG